MNLMNLTPEIRNRIYSYVVAPMQILITTDSIDPQSSDPSQYILCHRRTTTDAENGLKASIALVLTSRQLNLEVRNMIYARTTFCFEYSFQFGLFLQRSPKEALACVKRLGFTREFEKTSGQQGGMDRVRDVESNWATMFSLLPYRIKSLDRVSFNVQFSHGPLTFGEDTPERIWYNSWSTSFTVPTDLVHVNISSTKQLTNKEKLDLVDRARKMADTKMTTQARFRRDVAEAQEVLDRVQAARKPLPILRLANLGITEAVRKPTNRVKKMRLEGYCLEDVHAMGIGEREVFYSTHKGLSYHE